MRTPSYLRVVATTRCNHQCAYCHMEGDPQTAGATELSADRLVRCVRVATGLGVRKIKFLGGEPLLRNDLEAVIERIRAFTPDADLSVITGGLARPERVRSLLDAGLDRINFTFHGFAPTAFAERVRSRGAWERRARFIDAVMQTGRPVKCNYVYRGASDDDDLLSLLDWAKGTHATVGLLDELQSAMGYDGVSTALLALRGAPSSKRVEEDPHSLPTEHWRWSDGLHVELKHVRLGDIAPYAACATCAQRQRCAEGIHALRLTHQGMIAPCIDRPELSFALADLIDAHHERGEAVASQLLREVIDSGFTRVHQVEAAQLLRRRQLPVWHRTGTEP